MGHLLHKTPRGASSRVKLDDEVPPFILSSWAVGSTLGCLPVGSPRTVTAPLCTYTHDDFIVQEWRLHRHWTCLTLQPSPQQQMPTSLQLRKPR